VVQSCGFDTSACFQKDKEPGKRMPGCAMCRLTLEEAFFLKHVLGCLRVKAAVQQASEKVSRV